MSLIDEMKKELAKKSKLNESANQVPKVSTGNTAAPVAAAKKEKKITVADAQAMIDAAVAKAVAQTLANVKASQTPKAAASENVVMTHISPYPAGISKRTGKPYPAGVKWHAKSHPVGTTAYGGLSMDDIGAMLLNFSDAQSLFKELSDTFEKYGKTSNLYKKATEEIIDLNNAS